MRARCPICRRTKFLHELRGDAFPGDPGYPDDPWIPEAEIQLLEKFARHPDGSRGFHYALSDDVHVDVAHALFREFARRMWVWLGRFEAMLGVSCEEMFGPRQR